MKVDTSRVLAGQPVSGLPDGHFIDGEHVTSRNKRTLNSFDPGCGGAFAQFSEGDIEDIDDAVVSAQEAFETRWSQTPPSERGRILQKTADLILENAEQLAIVECLDCGKPLNEARGDVYGAARAFEYYAGSCDKLQGSTFPLTSGYLGYSLHEPIGVTAHIIPWNFPISTAARSIAPALAAGCTVVAKPAEQTPFTALLLAELLNEAGLPPGACNVVTGTGASAGVPLVAHNKIDQVTFTGSFNTGSQVMKSAADRVARVVLELGGKSPVIVMNDCDQKQALDGVMNAIFENAGQICSAGSRLVIEKGIHAQFVEKICARAQSLTLGHGLRDPQMGPVNSAEHLAKIAGFLDRSRDRGAHILTGGSITQDPQTGKGWFYEPTIVDDRPVNDELVQEEIFGPVLTIQIAEDAEHAVFLANASQYALTAGVYTANVSTALLMARDINAGQIYINEYFAGGIEVPFGGNKKSGFGREKGLEGIASYCKTKSVVARI